MDSSHLMKCMGDTCLTEAVTHTISCSHALKTSPSAKGKHGISKPKPIRFHPCSPGQILQMAKLLGVNVNSPTEPLCLAVLAPIAEARVPVDQDGNILAAYCEECGAGTFP